MKKSTMCRADSGAENLRLERIHKKEACNAYLHAANSDKPNVERKVMMIGILRADEEAKKRKEAKERRIEQVSFYFNLLFITEHNQTMASTSPKHHL